jgi:Co/Zn/Cd efflux system component
MTFNGRGHEHANEHTYLIPSHQYNNKMISTTSSCTNLALKADDSIQSSTKRKLAIATTIALLFFGTELIAGYLANSLGKMLYIPLK